MSDGIQISKIEQFHIINENGFMLMHRRLLWRGK
jgi:hypothetical protein